MTTPSTPETSGTTSPNLLDRIKARDPQGWQQFVKLYTPLVYYWCRKGGLPAPDAADVTQEIFRSVLSHAAEFNHTSPGDTLRGKLFSVVRGRVADQIRKSKAQEEGSRSSDGSKSPDPRSTDGVKSADALRRQFQLQAEAAIPERDKGPADPAIGDLIQRSLQLVKSKFEPATWQAFWRVTVEGQTPAEVAADLKISTNDVYKARSQVLSRLRDDLGDRVG